MESSSVAEELRVPVRSTDALATGQSETAAAAVAEAEAEAVAVASKEAATKLFSIETGEGLIGEAWLKKGVVAAEELVPEAEPSASNQLAGWAV